jgi:hypothetical protein
MRSSQINLLHRSQVRFLGTVGLASMMLLLGGCKSQQTKEPSLWDTPPSTTKTPRLEDSTPVGEEAAPEIVKPKTNWRKVHSEVWYTENSRIRAWRLHYDKTRDPWLLWNKSQEYVPVIRGIFADYNLPNELCLLPMVESSFNPHARSTNAAGMWQFVEGTGKDMGLVVSNRFDERLNWKSSTEAAAKYLSVLATRFDGDWALVLAAYNMGPGAIERAMAEQGTNNYWELKIKQETTDYVPKFLAMLQLLRESYPKP